MVTRLPDCGKDNLKEFYWDQDGKVPEFGTVYVLIENTFFLSVYVDARKMTGRKQNLSPMWLMMGDRHHFLTTCIWDVLNVKANETRTQKCFNHEFLLDTWVVKTSRKNSRLVL